MDFSNTTEKQKESMVYWGDYISHLCTADNEIRQSQKKERESKCGPLGNIKQFYRQDNEMDVAKAFWNSCPSDEGSFDKTTNVLYLETMLSLHQNQASDP